MEKQDDAGAQVYHDGFPELRRRVPAGPPLVLSELERGKVYAPQSGEQPPRHSGLVRETCPNCAGQHLTLVLRQEHVRLAHLFCEQCNSCFDAHYLNGRCALTI